jgi:hypothetical protein
MNRRVFCHCATAAVFYQGNTKGGSLTVPLTSSLTGLDYPVLQIKTNIFSCHTADSKPVKQEVNGTVILPPLVFPGSTTVPLSPCSTQGMLKGEVSLYH